MSFGFIETDLMIWTKLVVAHALIGPFKQLTSEFTSIIIYYIVVIIIIFIIIHVPI